MANVNAKWGLRPSRKLGGGFINQNEYSVATDYATPIYTGDPVQLTSTGRQVILAEATNTDNLGVFRGCSYTDSTGSPVFSAHWPGASDGKKDIKAYIIDDPDVIFEMATDSCAIGEVGVVCDWNAGTGNARTGISGAYAVVSGTSATTGGSLRVMRLVDRPDNEYGAYAKVEVMFAEHVLSRVVSGVGGI